jgi:hypothetical protein
MVEHGVEEPSPASGPLPPLSRLEFGAVVLLGVLALGIIGVGPALLGALVDEHRLSASGLGLTAMLELLCMGVVTGLAGAFLKAENLRAIGLVAALLLAVADAATMRASGEGVMLARAAAGVPEGLLLWITVGMIARSETPERTAGIFFTSQVVVQLALAAAMTAFVVPRFGANGGFAILGIVTLSGLGAAMLAPRRFGPLTQAAGTTGPPPPRGLVALLGTLLFVAANGAVSVYLQPLAHQAGLSADVARLALTLSLAAQILGGLTATALAGKVRYFPVFVVVAVAFMGIWAVYSGHPAAWMFVGATMLSGVVALLVGPFLVPMTIEADPSRRAAMQSAGAQLFGGALGPLLAAFVVSDKNVHAVLVLGASLLIAGLAVIAGLHFTAARHGAATSTRV